MNPINHTSNFLSSDDIYGSIVNDMHDLYEGKITHGEASEAANNLIGFCRLLIEIQQEIGHNKNHVQCP